MVRRQQHLHEVATDCLGDGSFVFLMAFERTGMYDAPHTTHNRRSKIQT